MKACLHCSDLLSNSRRVQCGKPECKRRYNADRARETMRQRRATKPEVKERERASRQANKISIMCAQCGREAEVTKRTAKYCSHECSYDARFGADRPRDQYSGLTKAERDALVASRRQCDARRKRADARRHRAMRRAERAKAGTRGSGVMCAGRCIRCGEPFVRRCTTPTGHCSKRCYQRDRHAARRALRRSPGASTVSRWQIFERDGWACHICGGPVARDATVPDPAAPTLDHVVPIARGGDHSEGNLKTAHFYCNSVKGDLAEGWSLIAA